MFERETNREKNLEKAAKEAKVKARKEAAKTSDSDKDRAMDEQDILKVGIAVQALTMTLHQQGMWFMEYVAGQMAHTLIPVHLFTQDFHAYYCICTTAACVLHCSNFVCLLQLEKEFHDSVDGAAI